MQSPYAWIVRLRRQRQPQGLRVLLPLLASGLAAPLARPVLLGFLDGPRTPEIVAAGTEAITFRLGALLVGAMALSSFDALLRGPDREVLEVHPIDPRGLLPAIGGELLRRQVILPLMAAILLSPLLVHGQVRAWVGALVVLLGAWLCGLGLGAWINLGAVEAAESPRLRGLLELLRGDNPRLQAALIYAPGVVLAVGGLAVGLAAGGLSAGLQGHAPGWLFLGLPYLLGGLGAALALPLAARSWTRASRLLAEVDAAWAGQEEPEEERRVYLEWLARGRPELLRALRQGWRVRRTWATGAWGLGLVGAFAGWSSQPEAPAVVLAVAGAAALLILALPARLAEGDPPWLDRALGLRAPAVGLARAQVAALYAQGALLPPLLALLVRQGGRALLPALLLEALTLGLAPLSALLAARLGARAAWAWLPLSLLAWAAFAGLGRRLLGAIG